MKMIAFMRFRNLCLFACYFLITVHPVLSDEPILSGDEMQKDPINVSPNLVQVLEDQGDHQFNPEFSEALLESLNPSNTVEELKRSKDFNTEINDDNHNETISESGNMTLATNSTGKNDTETKLRCQPKVWKEGDLQEVQLLNSSALIKALTPVPNVTNGECALVMFYSPWCPFSAKAAPHYNSLPRFFPHLSFYALDAISHTALNMRYGLVAIPTLLLFHNGKGIVKFNESEPVLEKLGLFVEKYTGIAPIGNLSISPQDYEGPLSSVPLEKIDYLLIWSWLFTITVGCWWFSKSSLCHKIIELIRRNWREAEAQHEHHE